MLELKNISKTYAAADGSRFEALSDVSITFPASQFCMILGPSGCGKTTMLNLIGGLDRPTGGEMLFRGVPSYAFSDADFDSYRQKNVGFVFQTYFLIPHLTVLANVKIALALSGVKGRERTQRAKAALELVGLSDKLYEKPGKLSGGQMQRVAIARALVNRPDIILADEPTGALDSVTGGQIMELLAEISRERLVIMVTHNTELAEKYGARTVKMLDGRIIEDTGAINADIETPATFSGSASKVNLAPEENPIHENTVPSKTAAPKYALAPAGLRHSKMSFLTALSLSLKNLLTKKFRTIMTAAAAALGIAGLALVFALSSGMSDYADQVEKNTYVSSPVRINSVYTYTDYNQERYEYPGGDVIVPYDSSADPERTHMNILDENYEDYLLAIDDELISSINFSKSYTMRMMLKKDDGTFSIFDSSGSGFGWSELGSSEDLVLDHYSLLSGTYPKETTDVVVIVDKYNRVNVGMLVNMGVAFTPGENLKFSDLLGIELSVVPNDVYYTRMQNSDGVEYYKHVRNAMADEARFAESRRLRVTGILRPTRKGRTFLGTSGIKYLPGLQDEYFANARNSEALQYQINHPETDVRNGNPKEPDDAATNLNIFKELGAVYSIGSVNIFAKNGRSREKIKAYLDAYNTGKSEELKIYYVDDAVGAMEEMNALFLSIMVSLAAFAAIALVVSSVMIAIIIYISVVERTKEIGLLRSLGARKIDIFSVFSAESVIIGFVAGVIGIITAFCFMPLVEKLSTEYIGIPELTQFGAPIALIMVALSCVLTFIAGVIPGMMAARKKPADALRTE